MVTVYVGLGSNLDQPRRRVSAALQRLAATPGLTLLSHSACYRSAPLGPAGQPDYINAVAAVQTTLPAEDVLAILQLIENENDRRRDGPRWGPRTLDLDLLLYGAQCIDSPRLTLPHPGLSEREFVLYPLFEIAPQLEIPGRGPLAGLVARCPRRGLVRVE